MLIKNLGNGDNFTYAGYSWTVIEQQETGCVALCAEKVDDKPFNDDDDKDWRNSGIKGALNETFKNKLIEQGATEEDLVKMTISLTAVNGDTDYGTDQVQIGLLTHEQYKSNNRDELGVIVIPRIEGSWWLLTAYSHNESYIGAAYTQNVMYVGSDGSEQGALADSNLRGVRPVIMLAPTKDVEYVPGSLDDEINTLLNMNIIDGYGVVTFTTQALKYIRVIAAKCDNIPEVQESLEAARQYAENITAQELYKSMKTQFNNNGSIAGDISVRDLMPVLNEKVNS